jgi:hypothetical protein
MFSGNLSHKLEPREIYFLPCADVLIPGITLYRKETVWLLRKVDVKNNDRA